MSNMDNMDNTVLLSNIRVVIEIQIKRGVGDAQLQTFERRSPYDEFYIHERWLALLDATGKARITPRHFPDGVVHVNLIDVPFRAFHIRLLGRGCYMKCTTFRPYKVVVFMQHVRTGLQWHICVICATVGVDDVGYSIEQTWCHSSSCRKGRSVPVRSLPQ